MPESPENNGIVTQITTVKLPPGNQSEVLALMTQGKSNKAIGRVLALAEPTVKNHVAAILKALNVKNRTEAAMAVVEHGWDLRQDEK